MNRAELVNQVGQLLQRAGFATSDPLILSHSGFDMVARRDSLILVVKIQGNVDSVERTGMTSMVALARAVSGTPLIVGLKTSGSRLEDGVVYSRFGIPVMSVGTLHDLFIEEVPPMVYSAPGGFFVRLDPEVLAALRGRGVSLGELAEIAGVSRRTIQMYEEGMGAKMEVALRLEEALGIEIIVPLDPLSGPAELSDTAADYSEKPEIVGPMRDVFEHLGDMGYSVRPFDKCPFDALTSDRRTLLFTGVGKLESQLGRRAKAIANISRLVERRSVLFVEKRGVRTCLEGAPLISYVELRNISDRRKIIEIIETRGGNCE